MDLKDLKNPKVVSVNPSGPPTYTPMGKKTDIAQLSTSSGNLQSSQNAVDASKVFQTPLTRIASGEAATSPDVLLGQAKSGIREFSSAGAQNAGPIGQGMLDAAPGLKPAFQGLEAATTPTNADQAQGFGQVQTLLNVAQPSAEGAGVLKDFLAARRLKGATNAVASTAQTMTKGEQLAATEAGRLKPTITGSGKFVPSSTEEHAGKLLTDKLTTNPVKDVPIIQGEIAARGRQAEQFLGENGRPVTPAETTEAFQKAKTKAARYLSPEQVKNYDHTMGQFEAELKDLAGEDPIAQNTGTYYKALKNFEQSVTSRLRQGNEALLTDSGSAQLQAAKDVRTTIRDIISEKHPEFKQQMYDITSLYDAQDNVLAKAVARDTFSKAHPILSKSLKYGAEITGAGALYEGAKKLGLPLPL